MRTTSAVMTSPWRISLRERLSSNRAAKFSEWSEVLEAVAVIITLKIELFC
jgi:hypothetical protein